MRGVGALLTESVRERNRASRAFFDSAAECVARAASDMARRFARGGRLLALGSQHAATDAQHAVVEFVHPVIVGKRALPALDVSFSLGHKDIARLARPDDIVLGFAPPEGDRAVTAALCAARTLGCLTVALPGSDADYAIGAPHSDPFIQQELIEVFYHTLWESVHVFLEHEATGFDAGRASFLYPFLDGEPPDIEQLIRDVTQSVRAKAEQDEQLRQQTLQSQQQEIIAAATAMRQRIQGGGTLLLFGNGGSATDANDLALDCMASPKGHQPIPAISLSSDAATLTAVANDVGVEAMFLRQIMAFARPQDVALAISTSGGSVNVLSALAEARRRGLLTVAVVGNDGGDIVRRRLADFAIVVRCDYIPRIQEVQASLYHLLLDTMAELPPGA
ncbi:MAG TPA: SIS domain-containing protein [Gemmatimonadaceae bacterium]|nr:SIS domain-containing protein [Gemmatimonadaceae bacterium]